MERIRLVAFYVFPDVDGLHLEVSVRTQAAQVSQDDYRRMTLPDLLCVVEAVLDASRPGDLVDRAGRTQLSLFRDE